jgi:hypothetical protein
VTTPRIVGAVAILLILSFAVSWFWKTAGDSALQGIERQNNEAGDHSDRARSDFDACPDGMWDFRTSKCRRAP